MGRFFLCRIIIDRKGFLGYFLLGSIAFFWGIYEILVVSFQSYLIGLLGIIFCNPRPITPKGRGVTMEDKRGRLLAKKRAAKRSTLKQLFRILLV